MKKITLVILFILLAKVGFTCEPCFKRLDLKESLKKADLVVVASKLSEGPHTSGDAKGDGWGGPDWYVINIEEILKGNENQSQVRVNGFDGMCNYGVNLGDGQYLLILTKASQQAKEYEANDYHAVDYACSIKQLTLKNENFVYLEETISFEKIKEMINE
jgi:hypothetical protein